MDLDAQVISAPLTLPNQASFTSFGGKIQISGNFTESTAKSLALDLQFGALPVTLGGGPNGGPLNEQSVSPTLGKSSLNAGLAAGIGGLILVLLYTIFYYRALGIVVVTGLLLTGALLWAIVSALSHSGLDLTLDLSGVTGLIVSVGITVDSYIVYFERLKDEARAGRSVRSTVDRAFQGAFRTVLAADLVSLIAALTLYLLSVGSVRGFAFFLGSRHPARHIHHVLLHPSSRHLARPEPEGDRSAGSSASPRVSPCRRSRRMTTVTAPPATDRPSARTLFVRLYRGETSFDFVGRRRWWYILSAVIIVAGLASLTTRGFNLGIDFKGGTEWQVPANGLSIRHRHQGGARPPASGNRSSRSSAPGATPPSRCRPTFRSSRPRSIRP